VIVVVVNGPTLPIRVCSIFSEINSMSASEEMNGSRETLGDCQECVKLKSLVEEMTVQM